MAKFKAPSRKQLIVAVLLIAAVVGIVMLVRHCRSSKVVQMQKAPEQRIERESFEMIDDGNTVAAPSVDAVSMRPQGPRCGIREGEHLGYKYQVPEELPSAEDLMPEESACDSYYDPEASQNVPYVFTYPLTGAITKTRLEQAGDMWRGDLNMPARDPSCDFKTIYNPGDQLLHGAFSDYTYTSQSLAKCDNDETWVRNAPIRVANEELVQDYE